MTCNWLQMKGTNHYSSVFSKTIITKPGNERAEADGDRRRNGVKLRRMDAFPDQKSIDTAIGYDHTVVINASITVCLERSPENRHAPIHRSTDAQLLAGH